MVQHYAAKVKFLQVELDDVFLHATETSKAYHTARKYYSSNRCSRYYFRLPGKKHDQIKKLTTPWGQQVTTDHEILGECYQFYSDLYTKPSHELADKIQYQFKFLRHIPMENMTVDNYDLLGRDLTQQELLDALNKMKTDRSPGLDGLTVEFYRSFWPKLGGIVFNSIKHAQNQKKMSLSQRRGLIKLIPKKDKSPFQVSNWRPITLLNVDFKLVSKALSIRLAGVIPSLVHTDQKGFVHGRYIGDNILDIYALINHVETSEEEGVLVLLDIEKAFDSVSWSFLRLVLEDIIFPEYFIDWVETLYQDKELRIENNGFLSKPITPTRGLAQGCSLSPLLFILVMETLALTIRANTKIEGICIGTITKKIALLADDALLALKANKASFVETLQLLQEFAYVSNLVVNKNKTLLIPIGKHQQAKYILESYSEFKWLDQEYFRYLGVDVKAHSLHNRGELCLEHALFAEDMQWDLKNRKGINHLLMGRIANVRSLAVSRLLYTFSLTPCLCRSVMNKMQSTINAYVWSGGHNHIRAEIMYLPYDRGGLLLPCLHTVEQSLKFKWLSRILNPNDELWFHQLTTIFTCTLKELLAYNIKYTHVSRLYYRGKHPHIFWQDILRLWCDQHFTEDAVNFGTMPLACNSSFTDLTLTFRSWLMTQYQHYGIVMVEDFLTKAQDLSPEAQHKLKVNSLMGAIPIHWLTTQDARRPGFFTANNSLLTVKEISTFLLNQKPEPNILVCEKWERDLHCSGVVEEWPHICAIRKDFLEIRMQTFYYQFIYRAYRSPEQNSGLVELERLYVRGVKLLMQHGYIVFGNVQL